MGYLNTHQRTTKPTQADKFQPTGRLPALFGVFVGFVKDTSDVQRNGRLRVWIPELGSNPENDDGWVIVNYCSPFAGATNVYTADTNNVDTFEGTQTSYGMWMIPPDINNQVLVMFINGDASRGIWIGCLYNQFMNNMIPGAAANTNNYQYNGKYIPVAEYNKNDTKVTLPDYATKPYEATKFHGVSNQGLINDTSRGVTSSSARREAPSNVFGIITPGPPIDKNVDFDKIRRKGGSSFIMDDGEGTEYVQLTTKTGAQIKIDETNGFVYLINRDGTAWVQMDQKGNIDIFGAADISMRAQRDLNIRADRNINIEAGQNIFIKAAKDTKQSTTSFTYDVNNKPKPSTIPVWSYVGEGKGQGGNIVMQALGSWHNTTKNSAFLTVENNNLNVKVGNNINVTTVNGGQNYSSKLGIKMTTNAAFDLAATGNIRAGSNGTVNIVGQSDVILCTNADLSLKATNNIQAASGNNTLLSASLFGVTAPTEFGESVTVKGALTVEGPAHLIADYARIAEDTGNIQPAVAPLPPAANPAAAETALPAPSAIKAEVKPLNEKTNILATWQITLAYPLWEKYRFYNQGDIVIYDNTVYISNKDVPPMPNFDLFYWVVFIPDDKFKRNAQSLQTTVSRFPTYEPCPEHENFSSSSIAGGKPVLTEGDKTYSGSSGSGNDATSAPLPNTDPGANNGSITGDQNVNTDINLAALKCQLSIHEGVKNVAYKDTGGLITGGIGHLMRSNEIPMYPEGTPISSSQVDTWYNQDSSSAIRISQDLFNIWSDLSDIRKRALVDLSYSLGKAGLSKFSTFISCMDAGNFNGAGQALRNSKWFTQVGKRGPNIIAMIVQNIDPNGCDKKFPG